MQVITTVRELGAYRAALPGRVGLVPTMGFLHEGHMSLVRAARQECRHTLVSVFVNPTQFGPNEDFDDYPRDFDRDRELCLNEGVECIFHPPVNEMYPGGDLTTVQVAEITEKLCGRSRPTHFRGVTTVVAKLFGLMQPHVAYFGQKDLQQSIVIKKMTADLNMAVAIKVCPILRESDGLAMSSRNRYLSDGERRIAPVLHESIQEAKRLFAGGETKAARLKAHVEQRILARLPASVGRIDYVEVVETERLDAVTEAAGGNAIALAVYIGRTRLIDNIIL